LVATNRMFAGVTASQMASASAALECRQSAGDRGLAKLAANPLHRSNANAMHCGKLAQPGSAFLAQRGLYGALSAFRDLGTA
jgi:hypothetical protein